MNIIKKLLNKKTICLSAGHSVTESGAFNKKENLKESDLNMDIVAKTAEILRIHGIDTLTVPDNLSLQATINWINERSNQIDVCVESHVNSGGGHGVEAWHYTGSEKSKEFCQFMVDAIVAETGMRDRGIKDESTNKHGKLGFVHDTNPLAGLVETGFIHSDNDLKLLKTNQGKMRIAKGLARGLLSYLGKEWKPDLLITKMPQGKQITELNKTIKRLEKTIKSMKSEKEKALAKKDRECQAKIKEFKLKIIKFIEGA
ncbi:MAG TPA: N-acetylmuramoyl-L-alanine amidase [bacterium]|nr:N-acetylmuramoyl-L-alanine amidase [bacterium]